MVFKNNKTKLYIDSCGVQFWMQNDRYHRLDGPAIIHPDGYRAWMQNGEYYRPNGPAIIHQNGYEQWF